MPDHEFVSPRGGRAGAHLGSYRRTLPVPLERVYENALDWERLPYVHGDHVRSVRCRAAGVWGWRVDVVTATRGASVVELYLDRSLGRWTTRVLEGAGAGTEIWTQVVGSARTPRESIEIVVDCFVPELAVEARADAGQAFARRYARFYDQAVAMMTARQRELDRRVEAAPDAVRVLDLGPLETLSLPLEVRLAGRDYVLARADGAAPHELLAFPRQCPHRLGPLTARTLTDGVVTCPWHGYRFDARTGENLSGQACRLEHIPQVRVTAEGRVTLAERG